MKCDDTYNREDRAIWQLRDKVLNRKLWSPKAF